MWAIVIIVGAVLYGIIVCCVEAFQSGIWWLGAEITLFWIVFLTCLILWG